MIKENGYFNNNNNNQKIAFGLNQIQNHNFYLYSSTLYTAVSFIYINNLISRDHESTIM